MSQIIISSGRCWDGRDAATDGLSLLQELESGKAVYFPELAFELDADERCLLDPRYADPKRKNISLSADGKVLRGVSGDEALRARMHAVVARFQQLSRQLLDAICPAYAATLQAAPASLRLHRVEGRHSSWRKDDSRLHVDAFPSRPLAGRRILRVFANVNPHGEPRVWRVGERFDDVARRFVPGIKPPLPLVPWVLQGLGITKSRRTAYDHLMLGLHDAMKADSEYQAHCAQETVPFAAGSVWVCYSDQVSHAVMSGQFMLEQTCFLPPAAMVYPELSPQRVLENLTGRSLV